MTFFRRKPAVADTAEWPVTDHAEVAEPEPDLAGTPYAGGKTPIFREGFYYLCDHDTDGNELDPDVTVPLVWRNGGFHYALPAEPNHFHTYGLNALDLDPGSE